MNMFNLICTDIQDNKIDIIPNVTENKDTITLTVSKNRLKGKNCNILRVESTLTTISCDEKGYMFFPTNFDYGVVKCDFKKRENALFRSEVSAMPVCGICENEKAVFVHIQGMDSDVRFMAEYTDGIYKLSPEFLLDGDEADEDIVVVYKKMPYASYSDMAKTYRKYQMDIKGVRPLKNRAKERIELQKATECPEIRIRMGWKPQPTPVRRQTIENEPPMKIACDIPTLHKIIDKMKEKGINKAEICLIFYSDNIEQNFIF